MPFVRRGRRGNEGQVGVNARQLISRHNFAGVHFCPALYHLVSETYYFLLATVPGKSYRRKRRRRWKRRRKRRKRKMRRRRRKKRRRRLRKRKRRRRRRSRKTTD